MKKVPGTNQYPTKETNHEGAKQDEEDRGQDDLLPARVGVPKNWFNVRAMFFVSFFGVYGKLLTSSEMASPPLCCNARLNHHRSHTVYGRKKKNLWSRWTTITRHRSETASFTFHRWRQWIEPLATHKMSTTLHHAATITLIFTSTRHARNRTHSPSSPGNGSTFSIPITVHVKLHLNQPRMEGKVGRWGEGVWLSRRCHRFRCFSCAVKFAFGCWSHLFGMYFGADRPWVCGFFGDWRTGPFCPQKAWWSKKLLSLHLGQLVPHAGLLEFFLESMGLRPVCWWGHCSFIHIHGPFSYTPNSRF